MGGELPLRCKNKRQFLQPASRELQFPEVNNEQAFFSGFSGSPRTEVRGEPGRQQSEHCLVPSRGVISRWKTWSGHLPPCRFAVVHPVHSIYDHDTIDRAR